MTDEQWLWIYANMAVDDEDLLNRMCQKCRDDMASNRCSRCGKSLDDHAFVNPNFDSSRFEKLSQESDMD
jgi:predicted amidophosphoribosyltransferase